MKHLLLGILSLSHVQARTWTDTQDRTIEADLVSADETSVVLKKDGKDFTLPLDKLSEADRRHVKEWLEESANQPPAAPGPLLFDGKELIPGGKVNVYEYDYSPERLERVMKKLNGKDTGFKIGLAVPEGFDPSMPQRVFIASCAVNNEREARAGNLGVAGMYAGACVANGWVCFVYDSNIGRSNHNADMFAAFGKLAEQWPGFKDWQFAVGGFSGGAKSCFDPCGLLVKRKHQVLGAFLAGCNEDRSEVGRKRHKASSAGYRGIKIYMSTGKNDTISTPAQSEKVIKSLRSNGMRNSRLELFDGGHGFHRPHFEEALKWFSSAD